jgi:hypothetical protein
LGYAIGAVYRGILDVPIATLSEWMTHLLSRIERSLKEAKIPAERACALMSTKGFILVFDWLTEGPARRKKPSAFEALKVWKAMLRKVRSAPLFPLDSFGRLLNSLVGRIELSPDYLEIVERTDKLLAERFGKHKLSEQAFERASNYYNSGLKLEAVEELHKARVGAFTEEKAHSSVQFCFFWPPSTPRSVITPLARRWSFF